MALKLKQQDLTKKPNTIVYGASMSGKTTFVVGDTDVKSTLFLSTDGNAAPGCKIAVVENYDDLQDAIKYALQEPKVKTIVLDLLDDAVAFCEERAMAQLGMSNKVDAKGNYGKFGMATCNLVKENVLRPLLLSEKQTYIVMHSAVNSDGVDVPCFGGYSRDAIDILNWAKGRSAKVVKCQAFAGVFTQVVESERTAGKKTEETETNGEDN
jgi:hypothetical protein